MQVTDQGSSVTQSVLVEPLDHLRPGARLLRPCGPFHARTGIELMAAIDGQRAHGLDLLILDLTGPAVFGPVALQIVVQIATELRRVEVGLRLAGSEQAVGWPLTVAGVRSLFTLHDTVGEALRAR
ncbi:STAS domain-containing protein [Amycolatopsis sp. CA-128772]|uniref:STAS domain-containing protein n=1 Tax=Amycolatopsis sp. CA-128772 TaxID=2073159 RepID=UPI001304C585|nr:STAS domain-containing protein [Amycolatopsis sp. CA-128772]